MLSGGKAFSSCHEVASAWKRWYCTKAASFSSVCRWPGENWIL